MSRHDTDITALVAGLVFVGIALAYLLDIRPDIDVDGRWVLPLALIGLGAAGLAASLRRPRAPEADQQDPL